MNLQIKPFSHLGSSSTERLFAFALLLVSIAIGSKLTAASPHASMKARVSGSVAASLQTAAGEKKIHQEKGLPNQLPDLQLEQARTFVTASQVVTRDSVTTRLNSNPQRAGYIIPLSPAMSLDTITRIIRELENVKSAKSGKLDNSNSPRTTVVLHFSNQPQPSNRLGTVGTLENTEQPNAGSSDPSVFEDQLKLARYLISMNQRSIRFVAWVDRTVSEHALLPLLAAETIIVSSEASIVGFDSNSTPSNELDEPAKAAYLEIAKQRALFPPSIVSALLDSNETLSIITKTDGGRDAMGSDLLEQERESGSILQEEVLSRRGEKLVLAADELRLLNISSQNEDGRNGLAEFLDLATLKDLQPTRAQLDDPIGCLLEIRGSISRSRLRRWQSNLFLTSKQQEINTWLIDINSDGGDLTESARFANWLSAPSESIQTVAATVSNRVTGDALLITFACRPIFLTADANLGGRGLATPETTAMNQEVIDIIHHVASLTGRSPGLIQGLIDPSAEIYRYTHRQTGAEIFSSTSELERQLTRPGEKPSNDPVDPAVNWVRGEPIDLSQGLTARMAIDLGLADGIAETPQIAANQLNLADTPEPVKDQGLVRFIERLGSSQAFAILLLFIGFAALSAEFSSPGLGIPGFIAILCFSLYFWIKLLSGTAEWLELVALLLGLTCIGIEFFIVPGFGVFGIGGFLLTGFSIVLMSQTFIIPRNVYQLNSLAEGVWAMLAGLAGLLAGIFAMRTLATRVPVLRALTMESPDLEAIELAEQLSDYTHLLGHQGTTTTPLHPSGKARFGDELIQVVSDGTAMDAGQDVTIISVQANHVVVRPNHLTSD